MRRALLGAAAAGALLLAVGVCWGFAARREVVATPVTALLLAGTVLCVAALAGAVVVERRPDGLNVPPGARLPAPHWHGPLAAVGACDVAGGAYASPRLAIAGFGLLGLAVLGLGLALQREDAPLDRGIVLAARRARRFAVAHGLHGSALAVEHVGRGLVRLVVVGADGAFGDVVVRGTERAEAAAALSGLPRVDLRERDVAGRIRTGRSEWLRMAGQQLRRGG